MSGPADDLSWTVDGSCNYTDPDAFFPSKGASEVDIAQVKVICEGCPVLALCREYALGVDEQGIWGGMTHNERRKAQRARRKAERAADGEQTAVVLPFPAGPARPTRRARLVRAA